MSFHKSFIWRTNFSTHRDSADFNVAPKKEGQITIKFFQKLFNCCHTTCTSHAMNPKKLLFKFIKNKFTG